MRLRRSNLCGALYRFIKSETIGVGIGITNGVFQLIKTYLNTTATPYSLTEQIIGRI